MSAVDISAPPLAAPARGNAFTRRLLNRLLFILILFSSFIIVEPAPYEGLFLILCVACVIARIRIDPKVVPLMLLLAFWNLSGTIALLHLIEIREVVQFIVISVYLSFTSVVFACVFAEDCVRRMTLMRAGYIGASVIVIVAGIIGYFKIGGEALAAKLTWAERATGTFKDPNLLGSFLILPLLYLIQRLVTDRVTLRTIALTLFLLFGLLLSFSRAAWGNLAFSAVLMMLMMFATTGSTRFRARIVGVTVAAVVAVAIGLVVMLSFDSIRDMFLQRAKVVQNYDAGPFGRFGRHITALVILFDHPKGLGAFEFSKIYGEAVHNTFLKSFISYGWLGGFSYLTMVALTLWLALRNVFTATPWQLLFIPAVAAYIGVTIESFIIDTDHWRHFHLLTGIIWGLAISTENCRRRRTPISANQSAHALL